MTLFSIKLFIDLWLVNNKEKRLVSKWKKQLLKNIRREINRKIKSR